VDAVIRRVTTGDDFQIFRCLITEYEESLPEDLRHSDFSRQVADLVTHYGEPHAAFVATIAGDPAGCVGLSILDAKTAVVKKMYVRPSHRNRGLARVLMAALTERARERGIERLVLDTARERLAAAYALYRSLGFRECAPYGDVDYRCPTFMELAIA
jgi:GNAT superfamily N-acetyltransferase